MHMSYLSSGKQELIPLLAFESKNKGRRWLLYLEGIQRYALIYESLDNTLKLCLNTFWDEDLITSEKLNPLQSSDFHWINICLCPPTLICCLGAQWHKSNPSPCGHRPGHCIGQQL